MCTTAYVQRATAYNNLRRYDLALEDCQHLIKLNPHIQEAYTCRAQVLERLAEENRILAGKAKSVFD
jgi:hypothetical protein